MSDVFDKIKKKLMESSKGQRVMVLSESEVANINTWLFTPTYDLNRILSGSLYKGVAEKTHTLLVGPEACLDEDTHIHFETWIDGKRSDHKGGRIKNLHKLFHKRDREFRIMSIDEDDCVFNQQILDVVKTGVKECYTLTTSNGYTITTSKDHKFYVGEGKYLSLGELSDNDVVYVHTNFKDKTQTETTNKDSNDSRFISYPDTIQSIVYVGERETYDIKCAYPYNNYIANNIVVHNSGKSSFMCLNLAAAQKLGYTPIIINAEGAWTSEFVSRWGLDATRAMVINSSSVEDIHRDLANIKSEGFDKLAIALDSIGALNTNKVIDDAEKGNIKADQGSLQKKIKAMMKTMVDIVKFQDSIAFSAGHYYGNPTGYGDPEQIGGGKYPRLAADYIVTLKKSLIYENPNAKAAARGNVLGTEIHAATIKNRFAPPFQEALFEINYRNGVNKIAGIVPVAIDMGLIEKGGSWYTIPSLGIKVQGEAKIYEELNKVDLKPLLDSIEDVLKTKGYSNQNNIIEESFSEPIDKPIED